MTQKNTTLPVDPKLVARSFKREGEPASTPTPAPTPNPLVAQIRDALATQRETVMQEVTDLLADLSTPNRAPVPDPEPTPNSTLPGLPSAGTREFGFGQVTPAVDVLYSELPEAQRAIRNPRSDAGMRDFFRALRHGRMDAADAIRQTLDGEYTEAFGRATTLYGTPNTTSGIGGGTGGPLVPLPLANLIILARNARARLRARVTTLTSAANTLRVPTGGTATAAMVDEGATASQGEPTLGSVLLSKKKAQALFRASDEMLDDASFNVVGMYTERAGGAIGALEDSQICTSDGIAPNITGSFETFAITDFAEASSTVMTYADVVGLLFTAPEAYYDVLEFFGNKDMASFLSQILDGNGRPIFGAGLAAPQIVSDNGSGQVDTLLGRRFNMVPCTAGSLIVGNPADYTFLDGGGMTIRVSEHTRWATDEVEWKVTQRFDGVLADGTSFAEMKGITSVA